MENAEERPGCPLRSPTVKLCVADITVQAIVVKEEGSVYVRPASRAAVDFFRVWIGKVFAEKTWDKADPRKSKAIRTVFLVDDDAKDLSSRTEMDVYPAYQTGDTFVLRVVKS